MTPGSDATALGDVWIDAQLPPALSEWLAAWGAVGRHVQDLGMLTAPDEGIFAAARRANAIVVTKDEDFIRLLEAHGAPPQVVWVTVGNVRNPRLRTLFERHWPAIRAQLEAGEPLVELSETDRAQ